MSNMTAIIQSLTEKALHPAQTAEETIHKTGKKAVGCFPIYVPEEIIYAGGLLPVSMWGGKTELKLSESYVQGFCCSIMKGNLEMGLRGDYARLLDAVIIPAMCDTLKCILENWKAGVPQIPCIGLVYPQMRWAQASENYLVQEFKYIRTELEKLFQIMIPEQKIEEAFALYEEYRATLREFVAVAKDYPVTITARNRYLIMKAAGFMDKREYTAELKELVAELKNLPKEKVKGGIRVVTTGLISEPVEVLDIFDENKVLIVADDVARESRQFRTLARETGDVWHRLMGRIIDQRGCTFLCEQKKSRGQMLIDLVENNKADAVVVLMMKFCDPEEFDYPVYKKQLEAAGIPVLYLEVDQNMDSFEQMRTRIQSFKEMLR